ncbi:MAG: GNAT family N-acetyltransferase [Proteobacteria bacterium]|nr:GNAT family N-acetyltransferase [Pseudomonadota bacterium]
MTISIRPLHFEDHAAWEPLWQGYLDFYETALAPEVTDTTWARLLDAAEPMEGLGAIDANGALIGFAITLRHRSSWGLNDYTYLEDLFVAPQARGQGAARALIEAVCERAKAAGSPRVYWLTQETNATAQALYDRVAKRSDFIVYRRAP